MFQSLPALPADPILGLMASYRADNNPKKIDLGIGIYKNENGDTPVMAAVKKAEDMIWHSQITKSYVGPTGSAEYNAVVAELLLGSTLNDSLGKRRITVQSPGGCGGLRLAAEFIKSANADATYGSATQPGQITSHCSAQPDSRLKNTLTMTMTVTA